MPPGAGTGSAWPSPDQELLLKAALLSGPEAARAWRAWSLSADRRLPLDAGSARLLPLVHRNLPDLPRDDPWRLRARALYRKARIKNLRRLHRIVPVIQALEDEGIEVALLKGAALVGLVYQDPGLRPMEDIDLLVRRARALDAFRLLRQRGFEPPVRVADSLEPRLSLFHEVGLRHTLGDEVDLHWWVLQRPLHLPDLRLPEAGFWERLVSISLAGRELRGLGPTDLLFHVCVHGCQWNPVPPLRWVADALWLLREPAAIDWQLMAHLGRSFGATLALVKTLGYLRDAFGAPVPETTVGVLARTPVDIDEAIWFRYVFEPKRPLRLLQRLRLAQHRTTLAVRWLWYTYSAEAQRTLDAPGLRGFLGFLRRRWGLRWGWTLPFYGVWRALRLATKRAGVWAD